MRHLLTLAASPPTGQYRTSCPFHRNAAKPCNAPAQVSSTTYSSGTASTGLHTFSTLRSAGALILTILLFAGTAAVGDDAEQFTPLCRDVERRAGGNYDPRCWMPVANHPGCHFRGLLSIVDNTSPVSWSGVCENGRAVGAGVLTDETGNRAEGNFVEGLKHGRWTRTLTNGLTLDETHERGQWHGPWTVTTDKGVLYAGAYVDNAMQGEWNHVWTDGYSEVGPFKDDKRHGMWTITWPNGYEAVVLMSRARSTAT